MAQIYGKKLQLGDEIIETCSLLFSQHFHFALPSKLICCELSMLEQVATCCDNDYYDYYVLNESKLLLCVGAAFYSCRRSGGLSVDQVGLFQSCIEEVKANELNKVLTIAASLAEFRQTCPCIAALLVHRTSCTCRMAGLMRHVALPPSMSASATSDL